MDFGWGDCMLNQLCAVGFQIRRNIFGLLPVIGETARCVRLSFSQRQASVLLQGENHWLLGSESKVEVAWAHCWQGSRTRWRKLEGWLLCSQALCEKCFQRRCFLKRKIRRVATKILKKKQRLQNQMRDLSVLSTAASWFEWLLWSIRRNMAAGPK